MFFKRTGLVDSNSVDALRKIMGPEGHIVKITPKSYKLSNGVECCSVGVRGRNGIEYSIQAYGKEALELLEEVSMITETSIMINPPDLTGDIKIDE